jgi:hypothetical protein
MRRFVLECDHDIAVGDVEYIVARLNNHYSLRFTLVRAEQQRQVLEPVHDAEGVFVA